MANNINLLVKAITDANPGGVETPLLKQIKDVDIPRPFHPLPDVSSMNVLSNVLDPLFAKADVVKKLEPMLEATPLSRKLRASNRYLRIMQNRLARLLVKGRLHDFWILALMLLAKSKVLRLVALRQVLPNWQRDLPFQVVKKLLASLDLKIQSMDSTLYIKRKYADKVKADGTKTWRPIGAPAFVDRMFLYLLQGFMVMCCAHYIGPRQFAYIPGRGVSDAWEAIRRYLPWPFVYEFDLKGAFPSVSVPYLAKILRELMFPEPLVLFLTEQSIGSMDIRKFPQRLPEPKIDAVEQFTVGQAAIEAEEEEIEFDMGAHVARMMANLDIAALSRQMTPPADIYTPSKAMNAEDYFASLGMTSFVRSPAEIMEDVDSKEAVFTTTHVVEPASVATLSTIQMAGSVPPTADNPRGMQAVSLADFEMSHPSSAFNQPEPVENLVVTSEKLLDEEGNWPLHAPVSVTQETVTENPIPIHLRGFPQGSGLSPILFNLVFAHALERGHFALRFPGAVLIAYADDFLVFSKKALGQLSHICARSAKMLASGLEFSIEKSRTLKENGVWKVPGFKFLGNTLDFGTGLSTNPVPNLSAPVSLRGTPRSGAINVPLPDSLHSSLRTRDKTLWILLTAKATRKIFGGAYAHPQEVLNAWGRGELPASLIPRTVIEGQSILTKKLLAKLALAAANIMEHGDSADVRDWVSPGLAKRAVALAAKGDYATLAWLNSRFAGFQQSLLFAPETLSEKELHGRKVFEPKHRLGRSRSWVQQVALSAPNLARHFSIYNSTSCANLYLLQMLKGSVSTNVRKGVRSSGYPVGFAGKPSSP